MRIDSNAAGFKKLKPDVSFGWRVERYLLTVRLNAWHVIARRRVDILTAYVNRVSNCREGHSSRSDGVARRLSRPMRIATES
jgi:hypothetical protein